MSKFELENSEIEEKKAITTSAESVNLVDLIDQPAWKSILLDLVKSEKMDPWSIDVGELADKFLAKINLLEKADLRLPANAILASAILLKFKAKSLRISSLEEKEPEVSPEEIARMNALIPDLSSVRRGREGRVSLDELVNSIESIIEKTKTKEAKRLFREVPVFQLPFTEENLEEKIDLIYARINERMDSQGLLLFSTLLDSDTPEERVNTFVPVLFLVNKNKINAWQEDFFGEIFISLRTNGEVENLEKIEETSENDKLSKN